MNENIEKTLENEITDGLYAPLYKRISSLSITDTTIRDAFVRFTKFTDMSKTFSVAELLYATEAIVKGKDIKENSENVIYAFDNALDDTKLLKNSVPGIVSLFSLHTGVALDMDKIGGSLQSAQLKRYLVLPEKKCEKLSAKAIKSGINIIKVGQCLSTNKIIINNSGKVEECIDKSLIDNSSAPISVELSSAHFNAFLNGYLSVCSLKIADSVTTNNVIRFGIGDGIENVLARALGAFAAATLYRVMPMRILFTEDNNASVAVPRPNVADGDYYYLLKLHVDQRGIPDRTHFSQLCYYLTEKKREGIIKDVLPVKENIQSVLKRLKGENFEYESLMDMPENCFGAIVSVPRGESVNGIKLGYFKYN